MQSSLGLAGDLDDVELIQDVEEAFGLHFADVDLNHCRTVGDLFALVQTGLSGETANATACATAMAFYRMRRALEPLTGIKLLPSTPIEQIIRIPVRRLYRVIQQECGLRPPSPIISIWGCLALALVAILPLASLKIGSVWWLAAASALPAVALYRVAPIRLPDGVATFGDFVGIVSDRSIGVLASKGARLGPTEAWHALQTVIEDHTLLPRQQIGLDTLIYASTKASASA